MPTYNPGEKVDILFNGGKGRAAALIVSGPTGRRGIGAMPQVRITRSNGSGYKGTIRAHADLITARRTNKTPRTK